MAECQLDINTGMLSPGVFNIKQYLNETEEMHWTVSSRYLNSGLDLSNYDAFLVLQQGSGEIDEVMLTKIVNNDTITLVWNIGKYATWLKGYVKYQIVFRGRVVNELSVLIADDEKASGEYEIYSEWENGEYRYWINKKHSEYKINYDTNNKRWQLLKDKTILSYQTTPSEEPFNGLWQNAYVGNVSAMAWRSAEAVMYISESIPADETITAKHPTILRQMWYGLREMIVKSGVAVFDAEITSLDWHGDIAPYYIKANNIMNLPIGCEIQDVKLYKALEDGNYSDIINIRVDQKEDGNIYIYCLEKIDGKLALTVKGGNEYTFVPEGVFSGDGVVSINGQTGAINLTAKDLGALTAQDVERLIIAIENTASEIANLQEQINGLTGGVVTAEDIAELQGQIDTIKSDVAEIKSDIDGAVAELEGI